MKYFKTILNVIVYFLIYFLSQIVVGMIFGIYLVVKALSTETFSKAYIYSATTKYAVIITAIADIIALVIFILMFRKKEKNLIERCKFKKISIFNAIIIILSSIGFAFLCSSLLYLTQNILRDYDKVANSILSGTQSVIGIICMIIIAPIFEEIFFRGIIFNELRKNFNLVLSIIIEALIFALMHGNVKQGIYAFVLGVITALVYIWTDSILSNIVLHMSFNLFGSLIAPQVVYYTKSFIVLYVILGIFVGGISLIYLYKKIIKT
ncbi:MULTISPECIES: CPBP family intramembrane glutamic endopeptidase [Clostridium]|uniref:CPBP family intramembrane glutamic endopeptidase n=1 Tax=Clostridium TaxID=1485 RepID=UPI000826D7A8|nr:MULTISPECIES: type II CAAX endopeptidase family protein [Clostridium]PJI09786.1 CPBP family intramembrane metalloprotease [Clostridium sp. CT7]